MILLLHVNVVVAIRFNQSRYNVDEDNVPTQLVLVLTSPPSANITVEVFCIGGTATGE